MEDSLFNRNVNIENFNNPVTPAPNNADNDVLLHALIMQGVGRYIREDQSSGKIEILQKLTPKTRNLKRVIKGINDDTNELLIRGADDAVDVLEVVHDIINSKFNIINNSDTSIPMNVD
ncbi:ORF_70 [Adoxophyes orana granulovirus]|uniref:ORF_70 n=1 Tax=Adoxophyes orana granulovirus TaxID=170617 RepID=Q7T9U5_GVAO|nr:ORF_70 [Adoxophyes orana granulovirus]AAP85707.1 ORF_70 [Adoxophyes orana granulovirus]AJA91710.1 P12 [Adoxophyes orana granulovirus]